jgi:hypothetical protein
MRYGSEGLCIQGTDAMPMFLEELVIDNEQTVLSPKLDNIDRQGGRESSFHREIFFFFLEIPLVFLKKKSCIPPISVDDEMLDETLLRLIDMNETVG